MSRRKQSNPKPLKVEEEWNEDGGKPDEKKVKEEDSPSGQESTDSTSDKPTPPDDTDTGAKDGSGSPSPQEIKETRDDLKIPVFPVKVKRESIKQEPRHRSQSRSSDLAEFSEVETASESKGNDGRRRRRRESESSSVSRRKSPNLPEPGSEMNGTVSVPLSSHQILQGLPYLHLLPPAMRNDAARLLFMPPILPSDLSGAMNAANGSVDLEKAFATEASRNGPGFFCKPCKIKFSSATTLDAHQTYYCASGRGRGGKDDALGEQQDGDPKVGEMKGPEKRERESGDEDRELIIDESVEVSAEGRIVFNESLDGNPNKIAKTGKLYACMYCSYSADKKVSLNRHMRMHSGTISSNAVQHNTGDESGPGSGSTTSSGSHNIGLNKNLPEGVNVLERYCQDCDIQFSNIKNFRVHKQHYCRTRHVLKAQQGGGGSTGSPPGISMKVQPSGEMSGSVSVTPTARKSSGSPAPSDGSPGSTPGPMPSQQPFVVLPTNPLIVVPYCFIQAASILPMGNILPSQNALLVLPNGSVQGLPFTSIPVPIPSQSPISQQSIASFLSQTQSAFSTGQVVKSVGPGCNSLSPTNQSHSVFNDPKDILRKISSVGKGSTTGYEAMVCSGYKSGSVDDMINTGQNNNNEIVQSENGSQAFGSEEHSDKSQDEDTYTDTGMEGNNDEGMPAIDLTLRRTRSIKEISGDEEKENREVCLRLQNQSEEQQPSNSYANDSGSGTGKKTFPTTIPFTDFHRERELCSPSERVSSASGSSGKRTPRPSSTSISSSCSTPPALCEPKVNGVVNRLSPVEHNDVGASANSKKHSLITMMMSPSMAIGKGSMDFTGLDMAKHKLSPGGVEGKGKRGRISQQIATQLPGGAILTTSGGQTMADLLIPNSPEFNEILAKISPQLRSSTGSPMGLNPALLQALSQSDPEIFMRLLDPTYLANLQQSIQQQQQQHASGKRGYSKCVECDIVFYKHENYLVHKEHYCAARIANNSPNSGSKEIQSSRGGKDIISSSRISACSSPAKSELDAEEISQNSPVPATVHRTSSSSSQNQMNIKVSRKSTDSSSSDFFPLPVYEKSKSRSPQGIASSISISPVPSPSERREKQIQSCAVSQYPCMYCGVKYSTIDNLKAHQNFYCTKRRNDKDSLSMEGVDELGVKSEPESDGYGMNSAVKPLSGNNKGLLQCGKCKLAIPAADQLGTHIKVCLGSNGSVPSYGPIPGMGSITSALGEGVSRGGVGWKCPCCDTYSPTVSQAQKHLEVHTGIKAFKCLLCGYRGNTLRGMRTHIRTHFDKRVSDLLEGEYMTCITANDVEHNVSTPMTLNKSFTSSLSDTRSFGLNHHPETTANKQGAEKNKLNHSPITTSVSTTTCSPGSPTELQDIKMFSTPEASSAMSTAMETVEKVENNNRASNCTLCNYTSSYRGNIIRHMKLVHKISEDSADKILTEMNSIIKVHSTSEPDDYSESMDRKLNPLPSPKTINAKESDSTVSNNVSSSAMENVNRRKNINGRGGGRDAKSDGDGGERNCISRSSSPEDNDGLSTLQKKEKPCAVKYCKSCDIYFNHLSSFDAHRKSYCSGILNNKAAERAETPVQ